MQQDALWQAVLGEVEVTVTQGSFITWFKNTCLLQQSEDTIVIGVPNIFIRQHLELKYGDLIASLLAKNGLTAKNIEYKVASSQSARQAKAAAEIAPTQPAQTGMANEAAGGGASQQGLNERYTLDSFVVGDSNDLAFAACQAVTTQPGT